MGSISDAITIRKRKFDVDEYHQLGEAGILGEDDRIELIEGGVGRDGANWGEHATIVSRLNKIFSLQCDASQLLHVQNPLRLDRSSEPQPDLVLVRFIRESRAIVVGYGYERNRYC